MPIANITARRAKLEYFNSSSIQHNWGSGGIGFYKREPTTTYVLETFAVFDTSVIPIGSVLNSCTIDISLSGGTPPGSSKDLNVFENNRSDPIAWLPTAPAYNSFSNSQWLTDSDIKTTINENFSGNFYTMPSTTALIQMVDRWVQQLYSFEWGCVFSSDFGFFNFFRNVDNIVLNVDYNAPVLAKTDYYYRQLKKRKIY